MPAASPGTENEQAFKNYGWTFIDEDFWQKVDDGLWTGVSS